MKQQNPELHFMYILGIGITFILSMSVYYMFDNARIKDEQIASIMKYAVDKGVDPMAVRCAYDDRSTPDTLCVIYTGQHRASKDDISVPIIKK